MEIAPSKATRKIVSIQWEQKPINSGRLYSDEKQSTEREFQSLATREKSWFGASSQKIVLILHPSVRV